jgi:hypothetical protein
VNKKILGFLAASAIALPTTGSIVAIDFVLSPQPAQAACSNWLCGWENATLKSQTDEADKKFTSNAFNAARSVVLIAVLGLGVAAIFTRDDKERSSQLMGWGGGVVVVALFMNVIVGYVFGDGKGSGDPPKTGYLNRQEKVMVALFYVQDNKI